MVHLQAYVGDKLGYQKEPIGRAMTIAVTDAGAVDGADIISEVSRAFSLICDHARLPLADVVTHVSMCHA